MFTLFLDKALDDKCSSSFNGLDLVLQTLVMYPFKSREEIVPVNLSENCLEYDIN